MTWTLSIILAFLFAASFLLGMKLGRRGRKTALVGVLISLPLFLLCAAFWFWPSAGYALARLGPWGRLYPWWITFFAFVLLGIASSPVMPRMPRIAFITISICYSCAVLFQLSGAHCWDTARLPGKSGRDGLCFQSNGWTCGPAAGVTLLAQLRIPTTEAEMAQLCGTQPWLGTSEVMLALAVREKASFAGYEVAVIRSNWQDLGIRRMPVIAEVMLPHFTFHYTVILAVDDKQVTLADPLRGNICLSREEFMAEWMKTLVTVESGDGGEGKKL